MADPNGWVKNPPSTFTKISGTSREDLNGQYGLVLQWNGARYTLLMTRTSQQVALKPENLTVTGYLDTARAYYELARHNPQLRAQFNSIQHQVETATGTSLRNVGIAVLVMCVLSFYLLGFSRTWLLCLLVGVGVYLTQGSITATTRTMAWQRWRTLLASQLPTRVTTMRYGMEGVTALVGLMTVFLWRQAGTATTTRQSNPNSFHDADYYYKLGFDDATAEHPFGRSRVDTPRSGLDDDDDDTPWDTTPPRSSSLFSMSSGLSLLMIGQTVYKLGWTGNTWDPRLAWANLQQLDTMRAGFLAFAVYRLLSAAFM